MAQIILAHAKINLFLKILGDRPDKFTEIVSLIQTISLADVIRVEKSDSGLSLTSNNPTLPLDSSNTVAKAWAILCAASGRELGVKIDIGKNIPIESGLGGGSSDAAASMIGIAREWGLKIDREQFFALGAAVGSDVPFFFGSGSSLIEGRGEKVTDLEIPTDYAILLIKPNFGMSTKLAYEKAKKGLTEGDKKISIHHLHSSASILDFADKGNALEVPFFELHPGAKEIKKRLIRSGAGYAALSGSGSCFFGIFKDIKAAESAKEKFREFWCEVALPAKNSFL
ncbi:4-(cytidine 5'-diphospho)-2-C-methyl-D-erythritol kinase [bacterium]|nr:4-(cytidine 5'-diphospho)-2-C-methyl-D-erythritol kinase [bacterium]